MFRKIFLPVIILMTFGLPASAMERVPYIDTVAPVIKPKTDEGPKFGFTAGGSPDSPGVQQGFAPSRNKNDMEIYYILPLSSRTSASFRMIYHEDADSRAGAPQSAGMVHFRLRF